jgi:hypothetical protein
MTEAQLHKAVADYLSAVLQPPTWWTTIGHGTYLGDQRSRAIRGGQMKRRGVKAGVPDICIIHDGIAKWIELKAEKGTLSDDQKACHEMLRRAGCWVLVCRSLSDVEATLEAWEIPTRVARTA